MKSLREHVRNLQSIEQKAVEKAGLRFILIREDSLFLKGGNEYMKETIRKISEDIFPELKEAAELGLDLRAEIKG